MIDVERQVAHWRTGGEEDWAVARDLVARGSLRHGLFFAHLALEKVLKAHVCRRTGDLAPRLHNLVRLAELSGLVLEPRDLDVLAELNVFNLAGRYPDAGPVDVAPAEARDLVERADGVRQWLTATL